MSNSNPRITDAFRFGTKAETLHRLGDLADRISIPVGMYFDVQTWSNESSRIISQISETFKGELVAIRSSAVSEDSDSHSMAGAFDSRLNVDSSQPSDIHAAVSAVVNSFRGNPRDQVLVQKMTANVAVSGVIMTHIIDDGGPYYCINYDDESGKTDTITGGVGVNKTVLVHRKADEGSIESPRVCRWVNMTRQLEQLCGNVPLDIEFVESKTDELIVLQVRRITTAGQWNKRTTQQVNLAHESIKRYVVACSKAEDGLFGSQAILGEMPDWNPAEIIGTFPRPLAVGLYRYLVTDDIWRIAREEMGYQRFPPKPLMRVICGRPYIDVRRSFNSFLPNGLSSTAGNAVVDAWLNRLASHPELHDKIEFEVAQTTLDFNFDEQVEELYGASISGNVRSEFKTKLHAVTRKCLDLTPQGSLTVSLQLVAKLEQLQRSGPDQSKSPDEWSDLSISHDLLTECRNLGTLPFAKIARHAFIAESLLRSAVARGALTVERLEEFKGSLVTVMGEMSSAFAQVFEGTTSIADFNSRFGHIRPGTYDITSLRYDQRESLFEGTAPTAAKQCRRFVLSERETQSLAALLKDQQLDHFEPDDLIRYASLAIVGRENSKFIFTRNLSNAMEYIRRWGESHDLTREDLSFIGLESLLNVHHSPVLPDCRTYFKEMADANRERAKHHRNIRMGYMLRGAKDVDVIPLHRASANFVTHRRVEADVVYLDSRMVHNSDLYGCLVCIENADPGFDWVFSQGIAGLVTKFGGSNSHMTIRCAEIGLPAAIGCGEQLFERVVQAGRAELNCADRTLVPTKGCQPRTQIARAA